MHRALIASFLVSVVALSGCTGGVTVTSESSPIATSRSLDARSTPDGSIVVTGNGLTVYDFAPDTATHSRCISTTCTTAWPPLIANGSVRAGTGIAHKLIGTFRRPGGQVQITYGGHPLYTWVGDATAGDVTGQALDNDGGLWYVVGTTGAQETKPFAIHH